MGSEPIKMFGAVMDGMETPEEFEAQTHGKTKAELYSATLRFFTHDPQIATKR